MELEEFDVQLDRKAPYELDGGELTGDDARKTLASTGRLRLARDAFKRLRAAGRVPSARDRRAT